MESFQMKKHRESLPNRSFPQRLDSIWQPASSSPNIEKYIPTVAVAPNVAAAPRPPSSRFIESAPRCRDGLCYFVLVVRSR